MDYELELKIKNGRITQAMNRAGITSIAELARKAGIRPGSLYKIINMQASPLNQYGEWRHSVLKMAEALSCLPASLFNDQQMLGSVETNLIQVPMTAEELARFLGQSPGPTTIDEVEEIVEKRLMMHKAMKLLSEREAKVLSLRMDNLQYDDIAKVMKLTRERVRCVETKASEKIRVALGQIKKGLPLC
jgi:RNA polymerase sigma factor (sigma-70 family)